MKVVVVMPLAEPKGGSELAFLQLIQYGQQSDIEWLVIFLEVGSLVARIQALGIRTYVVEAGRLRQPHRFIGTILQLAAIARQNKTDVMFSWMTKAQLYVGIAAVLARQPAVWFQHGKPSNDNWIDRVATWLPARGILACSKTVSEAQAHMFPFRPTRVVYPGVDLEKFDLSKLPSPTAIRHSLGLPTNSLLIGMIGRLQRWKGMHTLISAMPVILESYPNTHCVIVGGEHDLEPDYLEYLENLIEQLQISGKVILAGFQTNVHEWMQAMDVIIHASSYEPFGLVIIEAMAMSKPVVASALGGGSEIITPELDGLLVAPDDPMVLAKSIMRYLGDEKFSEEIAQQAKKRASEFSAASFAQNCIQELQYFGCSL